MRTRDPNYDKRRGQRMTVSDAIKRYETAETDEERERQCNRIAEAIRWAREEDGKSPEEFLEHRRVPKRAFEIYEQAFGYGAVSRPKASPRSRRVFVVHGHDEGPREAVARFLERLGFQVVILHEQANRGRTIITKFREEAADIGFAVVLMTPDDHGGKATEDTRPRARQNVVFELGFFIGALGPDRVAALIKGAVERPSDLHGVLYIDFDSTEAWQKKLAKSSTQQASR